MSVRNIQFGDEGQAATRELLRRFEAAHPGPVEGPLHGYLRTLESIDRRHGGLGVLPLEDAADLAEAAIRAAGDDADLALGIALWAMRHEVEIRTLEPVANALAQRSNAAASKQELAAVFGLMQGLVAHVSPWLSADLERSNPERPWRILHANFAITAIRTEDPALMSYAFDALDAALPDERASFYSEALALALAPRIPAQVRELIAARHLKFIGNS